MVESVLHGEFVNAPLLYLKNRLTKADGKLIKLGRKISSAEPLAIAVRLGERTIYRLSGYNAREVESVQQLILIDALADETKPIGHLDLYIDDDIARGSVSMRSSAVATTEWQKTADELWTEQADHGLRVLPEYRGQGVGSMLFAVGAVVLHHRATTFDSGYLTEAAKTTYRKFGFEGGWRFVCATDDLATHQKVNQVLLNFL